MILKSTSFRKHVKLWLGFLTVFSAILTIFSAACIYTLLFICKIPSAKEIYQNSVFSIVELKAYTKDVGESFGTAEFIKDDGTLITNAHVVTYTKGGIVHTFDEYSIRFASDSHYVFVSLIKYDRDLDIAVLKMDTDFHDFKSLNIADSSKIKTGDKVYAIGNSANYGLSMAQGIIGSPLINIVYGEANRSVIQASINITEGNSGGALLDEKGRMIGITTFRTKDSAGNPIYGIAYCVPINTVLEYIKK